jgi:hypothetical protein
MTALLSMSEVLLDSASKLNRAQEQRQRETGEDFNLFQILRIGHLEVKTHSPMIGELLDPKGRHGRGAAFLNLFLKRFPAPDFDAENARVSLEYHAGPRTETSGGRIDIVLTDPRRRRIFIENKVYAGDQENQLTRYHNLDPLAVLIYLTLEGTEPEDVTENQIPALKLASYRKDIIEWLQECEAVTESPPVVTENITQYRRLLETLTHQSQSNRMNEALINQVVASEESLGAFFSLCDLEDAVHEQLFKKLDGELEGIRQELGLDWHERRQNMRKKYGGFSFTTARLTAANLHLCFEFDAGGYHAFFFGFALTDPNGKTPDPQRLLEKFQDEFTPGAPTTHWPAWAWYPDYQDWGAKEFIHIRTGAFARHLEKTLRQLLAVAEAAHPNEAGGGLPTQ